MRIGHGSWMHAFHDEITSKSGRTLLTLTDGGWVGGGEFRRLDRLIQYLLLGL